MKTTKRLILLTVLTVLAAALLCVCAGATYSSPYTYTVSGGKATITKCYTSVSGALTIPSALGGYRVTSIGSHAFEDCTSLTAVIIPDSVTSIGNYAFEYCSKLTTVTIPDSVTTIGNYAFLGCSKLTTVTIPDGVTSIGDYAFYGCDSLTTVTIPDGVTSISYSPFAYCSSLTGINVAAGNANYSSVDGVLYNKDQTTLICYPAGKTASSFTIPDSVTSIGNYAFNGCTSLTAVTILDSVTSIGYGAFDDCDSLTAVTIGNGVTRIVDHAFDGCTSLTSVTIPNGVTSISYCAFFYCTSLTAVTIPDSVAYIDNKAFQFCDSLTDVYYTGTEAQRQRISIYTFNSPLTSATWHYNASPLAKAPSSFVPSGKYRITVVSPDFTPIEGASVTWKDDAGSKTLKTDKNGCVLFDRTIRGFLKLTASKNGYITWINSGSFWSKSDANQETVVLYPNTTSSLKLAVARYSNISGGSGHDVLTHTKSISLGNDAPFTGDLDFGNFYLKCSAVSPDAAQSYALWQGKKKIATSPTGDFGKLNSGSFAEGGNCFVRVTGKDGKSVDTSINLSFSKSSINPTDEISLNGKSISVKVGDDVPFLGGSTIDFDLPIKIPLTYCATDESIAIGFNADIGKSDTEKEIRKKHPKLDDKAVKEKVKQKDLDDLKKTIKDVKKAKNTSIDKNTKKNLKSLMKKNNKAKFIDGVDMSVIGYAEANWGSSTAKGEIAFVIETKAVDIEYNTVVVVVPVTVQVGLSVGATAAAQITYDWEHATLSGDVTLAPSIGLTAFGGAGVSKLVGVGAYGSATLDILLRILGSPAGLRSIDLTGELGLKAYLGWFSYEKPFAYNTWHLYTANNTKPMLMDSQFANASIQSQLCDACNYREHDLGYLFEESPWLGKDSLRPSLMAAGSSAAKTEFSSLLENTYRNAQPTATAANGKAYAAFLRADKNGNIYTAVTKYDGIEWKVPVRADKNAVLDNAPSLCTDANGTVWLAYTQTNASADKTSFLSYANAQTLVVGTVDADTLAFTKTAEYTGNYIHMATLTLEDGNPALVWAESEVGTDNDVLMPEKSSVYNAKLKSGTWQNKQLLAEIDTPLYDLVPSNGTDGLRVACLVDADGDLATADDTELREGKTVLAEDVRAIGYAKLPNESKEGYIWIKDGILCSEAGTKLAGVVGEYSVTDDAVFFSNPDANLSVYKYADGAWSEAITLTKSERYLEDLTALDTTYGEIVIGMNTKTTIIADSVTDAKDLVWSKISAVNDLRVEYVDFDDAEVPAGENITVTVGVTNAGDHTVRAFSLMLNNVKQTVQSVEIAPGKTAELTFVVKCPNTLSEYTVEVNETGATDYTPVDNAASFRLGIADLTVSASAIMLGHSRTVEAVINNVGIAPAGGILTLYDEEGNAVSDAYIPTLAFGESAVVSFSLSKEASGGAYSVELESDEETERAYNNSTLTDVPDIQYPNEIKDIKTVGDSIQITVSCGEEQAIFVCAFYNEAGKLINVHSEKVSRGEARHCILVPENAHDCKAFLLDSGYTPIMNATKTTL